MAKNLKESVNASKFTLAQFTLRYQPDHSLSAMFRDLLAQAYKRQIENQSVSVAWIVLHYLIYAQLELMLVGKGIEIKQCKSSSFDAPTTRAGDFLIKQVATHVTTLPTLGLIEKCKENLENGQFPIIIAVQKQVETTEILANAKGLADRIEILAAEQFLVINFYQLSNFGEIEYSTTLETLVSVYNTLIDRYETDPSLRISIGK